ncbi:MAG TPA: HD domain-containing phosphohydrolase [Dehalococcoidia bacterium]|nr:HD domain-containing phosphohydrolase [Dehalococcoidia bacterium]
MTMPGTARDGPPIPLFSPHVQAKAMEALNVVILVHGADRQPFQLDQLSQLQVCLTQIVDCLFPAVGDAADFAGSDSLEGTDYTHPIKVAELAVVIGRELGKPRSALIDLAMAASLMNIGNLSLRRTVIDEPRRLLESEWEEHVHAHPGQGVALLADSGLSDAVVQAVGQHHERMDGSGYPAGLRDDQIVRAARILAVADTFISLRSLRPYRAALAIDDALREISDGSGKLFDPEVVAAFETALARYTGIARDPSLTARSTVDAPGVSSAPQDGARGTAERTDDPRISERTARDQREDAESDRPARPRATGARRSSTVIPAAQTTRSLPATVPSLPAAPLLAPVALTPPSPSRRRRARARSSSFRASVPHGRTLFSPAFYVDAAVRGRWSSD